MVHRSVNIPFVLARCYKAALPAHQFSRLTVLRYEMLQTQTSSFIFICLKDVSVSTKTNVCLMPGPNGMRVLTKRQGRSREIGEAIHKLCNQTLQNTLPHRATATLKTLPSFAVGQKIRVQSKFVVKCTYIGIGHLKLKMHLITFKKYIKQKVVNTCRFPHLVSKSSRRLAHSIQKHEEAQY